MLLVRLALAALVLPAALPGQAPVPAYRGFTAGAPYREFAERARALARRDTLRCNTSRKTARLMECGVQIRDPVDSVAFYLSAYVLDGKIAMVAFTDSGGPRLVERTKRDLARRFGAAQRTQNGMWEWKHTRRLVRFNWRGRGDVRWISITLTDLDVMDGIHRFASGSR